MEVLQSMVLNTASSVALASSQRGCDGEAGSAAGTRKTRDGAGSWAGAAGAGVCVRIGAGEAESRQAGEAGAGGGRRDT